MATLAVAVPALAVSGANPDESPSQEGDALVTCPENGDYMRVINDYSGVEPTAEQTIDSAVGPYLPTEPSWLAILKDELDKAEETLAEGASTVLLAADGQVAVVVRRMASGYAVELFEACGTVMGILN